MDALRLYGNGMTQKEAEERIESICKKHAEIFSVPAQHIFSAAGRTELGGNHTDHNLGKVLAASISLDTVAAVHETMDYDVIIESEGFSTIHVDISNLDSVEEEAGTTASLVRGLAAAIVNSGGCLGGFSANISSLVMPGSGLSSSASVEVLIGHIFNVLFNDGRFSSTDIAKMGQWAENNYFKKPCGLMDQVACANGGVVEIDFKDNKNPVITPIDINFEDFGYDLVIVNTGSSHADLAEDYAAIPGEMKSVARELGKESLREVDTDLFWQRHDELEEKLGKRPVLRAEHFFEENFRVQAMVKALKDRRFEDYLALVNESGISSRTKLQNVLQKGADENNVSKALDKTEEFLGTEGAFRVHGGGFAGTIQAYIPHERVYDYIEYMEALLFKGCCSKIYIRNTPVCEL